MRHAHNKTRRCRVGTARLAGGLFWLPLFGLLLALEAGAATLTVTTLGDNSDNDGECSLREALWNADTDAQPSGDCPAGTGDDNIAFESALFSGSPPIATINLASHLSTGNGNGPTGALTIAPPAGYRLVLQGSGAHRVLGIGARTTPFVLEDTEIHGGRSDNGAGMIFFGANARLTRVRFFDNVSNTTNFQGGGALYLYQNEGALEIEECVFEDNAASNGNGGALYSRSDADFDIGISDSVFTNNSALEDGGAIVIRVGALPGPGTPSLDIASSRFEGNLASVGGAVSIRALSTDSRIAANIADTVFRNNRAGQQGGAIAGSGHEQGGQQNLAIRRSSFIENGVNNLFSTAGGMRVEHMGLRLENSLLSENYASLAGAALVVRNQQSLLLRDLILVGNSFYRNQLTYDTSNNPRTISLSAPWEATGWSWHLAGNLFAAHPEPPPGSGGECELTGSDLNLTGGANLSDESSCLLLPGDTEADPQVALATTGDSLKPRSLLPQTGSPAIDLWPAADCNGVEGAPLADDLRGEPRPRDGDGTGGADCDAGAFELPDAGLVTVTRAGTGGGQVVSDPAGIDCGSACSVGLTGGTELRLTASANAGSVFAGWSGHCGGTDACELEIDGDKNVIATFDTAPSFQLELDLTGDGGGHVLSTPSGIDCGPACVASFADGAGITLTAAPDGASIFNGWSGGGCSGTGDCVLTLTADTTLSALFDATHFPVDVSLVGGGNGSVTSAPAGIDCPDDCSELFERTETVTLTAGAAIGSAFAGWEGDCAGAGTDACVLDMDLGPVQADARFERLRTLTVNLSGGGSGSVTSDPVGIDCPADCDADYINGTSVTLSATADAGSAFAGWSGACSGSGDCTVTMDSARTVGATFQTGSFTLDVSVTGPGSVTSSPSGINCPGNCSETYLAGTEIELTATPDEGNRLTNWNGDCAGIGVCTVTMDQARTAGALFEVVIDEMFSDRFESP